MHNKIFEKNYREYMEKIKERSLESVSELIGGTFIDDGLEIPLLNEVYRVANGEITDISGNKPSYDICIILSKYLLMCPEKKPVDDQWVAYRDFKDSGPLIKYFNSEVELAISSYFSGKQDLLRSGGTLLGGFRPELDVKYDLSLQFDLLPKIPALLLFNDRDEEFSSTASVLFEKRAEQYLDAECLAIIGARLFDCLKNITKGN